MQEASTGPRTSAEAPLRSPFYTLNIFPNTQTVSPAEKQPCISQWLCDASDEAHFSGSGEKKTFKRGEMSWASNQRLLPGWGTEGREAPQCVSKLIKASTNSNGAQTHTAMLLLSVSVHKHRLPDPHGHWKSSDNTETYSPICANQAFTFPFFICDN